MPGKLLDSEIQFRGPIPDDIGGTGVRGRSTSYYDPYDARDRETGIPLDNNQLLRYILKNSDIDILLRTLGNAFFPRSINVLTGATELIAPNRSPRGYIIINPNTTVSGVVTSSAVFPAGTVFPVGVTNSADIAVGAFGAAAFILNITEATAGPMTIDLYSKDPITGVYAIAQTDLFGGVIAVGSYYANVGAIGIDDTARLVVNVAGDSFTGSITAMLKPALAGTVAGPTVFLGDANVNTTIGYPLLGGQKEVLYLKENTPLFGIATATTNIRVFELQ